MKITDIQAQIMSIPGPDGVVVRRNWIFVRILTDAGLTGLGEATTEYHEMAVKMQIETELKPRLVGMDPTDIEQIWQLGFQNFWWRRGVVQTSAMSGVDMALWDIAGKAAGAPVFKLLGGKVRGQVRLYARADFDARGFRVAARQAIHEEGFDAFKYGFGTCTQPYDMDQQVAVAIEEFSQLRQIIGPKAALMCDAASMFDPQAAQHLLKGLSPLNMLFVEEPTHQETIEPTLRLKKDFPEIKIALGERLMTRWDCRPWFEQQAIDVCQADICHTGGISELMRIAHFAEIYGIQMAPHNPYGPVALAASAHAAAAMQNFLILEHCRLRPWFEKVQTRAIPIIGGRIDVNELAQHPGLGVELDWDLVCSRPYQALAGLRYLQSDGSTPLV
jgi:galactonate dehydratase